MEEGSSISSSNEALDIIFGEYSTNRKTNPTRLFYLLRDPYSIALPLEVSQTPRDHNHWFLKVKDFPKRKTIKCGFLMTCSIMIKIDPSLYGSIIKMDRRFIYVT